MKKSHFIVLILAAVLLSIGSFYFAMFITNYKKDSKNSAESAVSPKQKQQTLEASDHPEESLGNVMDTDEITKDYDVTDLGLEIPEEEPADGYTVPSCFAVILNDDLLKDLLTLQAIGDLKFMLSDWLISKGYPSDKNICFSVDYNTIIFDRSLPYFELIQQDDKSVRISALYDFETYSFQFKFK